MFLNKTAVFCAIVIGSAALVFVVQPMYAKLLLPSFGGSAVVWSTSMMFFQGALFLGYTYAFLISKYFTTRVQVAIHVALLALGATTLPFSPPMESLQAFHPIYGVVTGLALGVGLAFVSLTATTPLVHQWYATSEKRPPYWLYAVSNAGSLLALLAFPILIEPNFSTQTQAFGWLLVYAAVLALVVTIGIRLWNSTGIAQATPSADAVSSSVGLRVCGLGFLPSAALLVVTTKLGVDIAAVPMLWVIPLVVYLISFTGAFALPQIASGDFVRAVYAIIVIALAVYFSSDEEVLLASLHILFLAAISFACHGQAAVLAQNYERPASFFIWLALGGWLGGIFGSLIAPYLFVSLEEYPLIIAISALVVLRVSKPSRMDLVFGLLLIGLIMLPQGLSYWIDDLHSTLNLMYYAALIGVFYIVRRNAALFFPAIALMLLVPIFGAESDGIVFRDRTSYGMYTVEDDGNETYLYHGTTIHGMQSRAEALRNSPTSYYADSGPLGDVFQQHYDKVAVVGLGTGSLACYDSNYKHMTFVEIDPVIAQIAEDERYFTYLKDCGESVAIEIGDGRLVLEQMEDDSLDLIVLDAFSSDSIPVHLLTQEAFNAYFDKLAAGGIVAVHVSNRYVDLTGVVANAMGSNRVARLNDYEPTEEEAEQGAWSSTWIVGAEAEHDAHFNHWSQLATDNDQPWTDGFSDLFSVLRLDLLFW